MSDMHRPFLLQPHPSAPSDGAAWVTTLQVQVQADTSGRGQLRYTLTGDMTPLRVPAASPRPSATDGLWRYTCFELFIGQRSHAGYREFNFSPSGDWAVYDFSAERVRTQPAQMAATPAPRITCATTATELTLDVHLQGGVAALTEPDALIGLTAVIESQDGALTYWALQHPAATPDFHHRAGWIFWAPH